MAQAANNEAAWVAFAHGLGDDIGSADWELLAELASVLSAWPARNPVTRRALDEAAWRLQRMAAEEAG